MSVTLYYSKLNLTSHIFDAYENPEKLRKILTLLSTSISEKIEYDRKDLQIVEAGKPYTYEANYKFSSIERHGAKYNDAISGYLIKTSKLFVNRINSKTGKVKKIPVENSEIIQFYFDVYKETVIFNTSRRFGYLEFNDAFENLINRCINSESKVEYVFKIDLLRKGLSLEQIHDELNKIGKIKSLEIEIFPPNPDDKTLEAIHKKGEDLLDSFRSANITAKSILFKSDAPDGINLASKVVKDEVNSIGQIHSTITEATAISKGYAHVTATANDGSVYTSKESGPVKSRIEEHEKVRNIFIEICKSKILALFGVS